MFAPVSVDEQVQSTNDEAYVSKLSTSKYGYFDDPFLAEFVQLSAQRRRSPLIHRGYYCRMAVVRRLLEQIIGGTQSAGLQILSLGAGFDTVFFQLQAEGKVHAIVRMPCITLVVCTDGKERAVLRGRLPRPRTTKDKSHSE